MPPATRSIDLTNFDLNKLEKTFSHGVFERKISHGRAMKICRAMLENKFYDNILRVCKGKKVPYEVIDGQHRIEGLKIARDLHDLQTYDLTLEVYEEGDAREIYRRLNLGKPLVLADHLKAMDTGRVKFFNILRPYCEHYAASGKVNYSAIVNCLYYAKTANSHAIRPIQIDDFVRGITNEDTEFCEKFLIIIRKIVPDKYAEIYWYSILRNLFRVSFENSFTNKEIDALLEGAKNNRKIRDLADRRNHQSIRAIYMYVVDRMCPSLSLKVKKGLIKD